MSCEMTNFLVEINKFEINQIERLSHRVLQVYYTTQHSQESMNLISVVLERVF